MTTDLIDRYMPMGDIYATFETQYGTAAADAIATAAGTGDETAVNAAITQVRFGNPLNTSTAAIFAQQLATDPLAAPLASANTVLSNTALSFLKNPMVLLVIVGGLFLWMGGLALLKGSLKK